MLVVDDDRIVAEMLSITLRSEGADVLAVGDAATAISVARRHRPDVIVIDPRLPDMEATEILLRIRLQRPGALLLLATPANQKADRRGRITACDEYVSKPFCLEQVLLLIRSMLRRGAILDDDSARIVVGDLMLNEDSREVVRSGKRLLLSPTEFELLRYFARNPNRVLTRRQIVGLVWPYNFSGRLNVVELYVSYLRKKVDAERAPMIHTLRGAGYILKAAT